MSELLCLCTLVQEQRTVLAAELICADRSIIEQCIAQQDCQTWFLRKLFKHRHDNDESLCRQIAQHVNCPMHIASIIYHCKPELLEGSARHTEIQVADLDSSFKGWHKLKKENENADNLAHYISAIIFKTMPSFYELQESPYPFSDIAEDKMRDFYRRTPDVVFEKFAKHPQTPLIKVAYQPIEFIAQQLPTMTPEERAIVARRNDLTSEVKQSLSQVGYQSELLSLCTLEDEQECVLPAELVNAEKSLIDQCIGQEDCQSWFLDKVFTHRHEDKCSLLEQIVQHNNCPWRIAAIVEFCKPELLEGSAIHAEIQLAHFDPTTLKKWNQLKQKNERYLNVEDYISEIVFEIDVYQQRTMRSLYQRTPVMVFEKFKDHKKTAQFHAFYQPIESLSQQLPTMKASERAVLPKRNDLTDELKLALVKDSSKLVKKNLLAHTRVSNELLMILAQDVNEPIAEMARKYLPKELQSQVNKQKANADDALNINSEKSILAYLRLEIAESSLLAEIATHASPLLCCAATVHICADKAVWNAAQHRTNLPLWSQIGLAQHSADSALLDSFIKIDDYSIKRALCDNPNLTNAQAKTLIKGTERVEIWAAIANRYIDDEEMLNFIIDLRGNESLWLSQLRRCLDPNVTSTELRAIHSSSKRRTLVLSRLIARNPKCTIPLMRLYGHYLPEDMALNPSYGLKLLEEAKRLKPKPYDDWKEEEYFTQGYGPECLYDWYLNQSHQDDETRKCPRSRNANPNKLRLIVLINDSAMHRRFIHENTQKFSEYEYQMLAYIGTPTLKKNILNGELSSNELVLKLLQDKDRSVVLAAEKQAKKRKLKLPQLSKTEKSDKPAKLTLKSLGNKAARLSLAKESQQTDIINLLVQDKLPDVRAQLAERTDINNHVWLNLLSDPIDKVSIASLSNWHSCQLDESESLQVQAVLKTIASTAGRDRYLRINALKRIADFEFSATLYQQGDGELDEVIIEHTSNIDIIETVLFAIERGHQKIKPYWLANNIHLSSEQKTRLLETEPGLIARLVKSCSSGDILLKLYQQHRPIVDRYRDSISFNRLRHITFSADELLHLYNETHIDDFIELAAKDLNKLNDEAVIDILKATLNHDNFYHFVYNEKYSTTVQIALLEMIESSSNSLDLLSYFAHSYSLPQPLIEQHINGDFIDLREAIASHQELNDEQLAQLLNDESEDVWQGLFESEKIANSRFPDWFLRRLAAIRYDYFDFNDESEPLVIEFKKRGISLETVQAVSANALVKQFNAKVTIKKFKQLLTDKGLMENITRTIEVEEWDEDDNEIKINKTINYNRLTSASAVYGYSNYEEYEECCAIAYYPDTFPELLELLDISVKA